VLVTGCAAAGFAVSENASYGRGLFSLERGALRLMAVPRSEQGLSVWMEHGADRPLASLRIDRAGSRIRGAISRTAAARVDNTGGRNQRPVLMEHCSQNAMIVGGLNRYVGEFCMIITLGGRLCALLLALGVVYVMSLEWRAFAPLSPSKEWLRVSPLPANRRARRLAALQVRGSRS